MRRYFVFVFMLLVGSIPSEARAGACTPGQSPFTDVPDGSIFCTEALWMRNALVTLGCGNGTTYCPADPVSRAQMALFMKRLARAVVPDIVYTTNVPSLAGDIDGLGFATCLSGAYTIPAGQNHRIMLEAAGTVSILTNAAAEIFVGIQYSENGGLFQALPSPVQVTAPGNQWTVVPVIWSSTITGGSGAILLPGSSYQWRILMQRGGGSTTGEVTNNRCQLKITIPVDATFL